MAVVFVLVKTIWQFIPVDQGWPGRNRSNEMGPRSLPTASACLAIRRIRGKSSANSEPCGHGIPVVSLGRNFLVPSDPPLLWLDREGQNRQRPSAGARSRLRWRRGQGQPLRTPTAPRNWSGPTGRAAAELQPMSLATEQQLLARWTEIHKYTNRLAVRSTLRSHGESGSLQTAHRRERATTPR